MRLSLSVVLLLASCGLYPGFRDPQPPKGLALRAFERDLGLFAQDEDEGETAIQLKPLSEDRIQADMREDRDSDRILHELQKKHEKLALANLPRGLDRVDRLARAKGLRLLGRSREARGILEGILKEDPDFFPATHVLAWDAFNRGDVKDARRKFREVVLREPKNVSARMGLARCLFLSKKEKDLEEAGRILRNLMENPREGVAPAKEWILELLRLGLPRKALAVARRAQKLFPEKDVFRFYEARALFDLGDFEGTAEVARKLAEKPGPYQAFALYWRFMSLRAREDFDGAIQTYNILKEGNFPDFIKTIGKGFFLETEAILAKEKKLGRRVNFDPREIQIQTKRNKDPNLRGMFLETIASVRNPGQKMSIDRTITWVLQHDPELGLRKLALIFLQRRNPGKFQPIQLGLQAKEPILRIKALGLMVTLPVGVALPKLLAHLNREEDPRVFRKAHEMLIRISGKDVYLAPGAEENPEARAKCREEWRFALSGKAKSER